MKDYRSLSIVQTITLIILRLLIGWQILYEGVSKLIDPGWSSIGFLSESKWMLSGFASWVISNRVILTWIDILNIWGLIAIGMGLILGILSRYAAISGAILLFIYYMCNPPLIGLEYSMPSEGSYLVINKTLIESAALVVVAVFSGHIDFGLESLYRHFYRKQ